jgi:hypothetical protein
MVAPVKRSYALLAPALVAFALLPTACGDTAETPVEDTGVGDDTGVRPDTGQPGPDLGFYDGGVVPDVGTPDLGFDDGGGVPDTGPIDVGPAPNVNVSGKILKLGAYLAGNNEGSGQVAVLALGVNPPVSTLSSADVATLGDYSLSLPSNGKVVTFSNKLGYFPSYNGITTQAADITGKNLYLAEVAWVNAIATLHNVDLTNPFNCHAPPQGNLNPNDQCIYAAVVGRILDDGTAGNGTIRPVGGVARTDFSITGGPGAGVWYTKGPYFLDYTGTASTSATSIVYNDNGTYRGGLYVFFAEIPRTVGPESIDLNVSITYNYNGANRYFGPSGIKVFRPYGVTWYSISETGTPPVLPIDEIDFDNQIYPLFAPVAQGGLGCQGCHTNQNGAAPSGGMNLYGAEAAYASLNPATYPARVNTANPSASLVLTKPLYEPAGLQDHPIVAFASEQDPAYQLLYTWIQEGGIRDVVVPPVSFANEIRPILYNATNNGGAGCITCHGDQANQSGGFYVGGDAAALHAELTQEAPTDNGATGQPYRVNKQGQTGQSLVLINPLFGNAEPHPVKIFGGAADPRYQLIYRWIAEGYQNN